MKAAVLSPRAREDLLLAVRWIVKDNPTAARALRDAVATAAQRIGEFPELGAAHERLAPLPYRFLSLTGFPYVIVYNSSLAPPLILRILHGARDIPEVLRE
jgi:toxin ParE1/3/4